MHTAVFWSGAMVMAIVLTQVVCTPLTVVSGKSGEQQVKEALDKAEKESLKAAEKLKKQNSNTTKADKNSASSPPSNDTSSAHEKENHNTTLQANANSIDQPKKSPDASTIGNEENAKNAAGSEQKQASSKSKVAEMAKRLSNLVLRFQRKMAADRLRHRLRDNSKQEGVVQGKKSLPHKTPASPLDLSSLTNGAAMSYKEDTKLEDRLAMEAEEERKFNNGETYEPNEDYSDAKSKSSTPMGTAAGSSLSPKEQASQEMQSYNALISTESNRELTQIQDEIAKATQSSMGQVSVDGENKPSNGAPNPMAGLGAGGIVPGSPGDPLAAALAAGTGLGDTGAPQEQAGFPVGTGGSLTVDGGQGGLDQLAAAAAGGSQGATEMPQAAGGGTSEVQGGITMQLEGNAVNRQFNPSFVSSVTNDAAEQQEGAEPAGDSAAQANAPSMDATTAGASFGPGAGGFPGGSPMIGGMESSQMSEAGKPMAESHSYRTSAFKKSKIDIKHKKNSTANRLGSKSRGHRQHK